MSSNINPVEAVSSGDSLITNQLYDVYFDMIQQQNLDEDIQQAAMNQDSLNFDYNVQATNSDATQNVASLLAQLDKTNGIDQQ